MPTTKNEVPEHIQRAFLRACRDLDVFILVRYTNKESLQYIGLPGYLAKPITCKAKTADDDMKPYKHAGLVVNPEVFTDAYPSKRAPMFREDKWDKTVKEFEKMKKEGLVRGREDKSEKPNKAPVSGRPLTKYEIERNALYTTDITKGSKHYGCLQYMGQYLHGDFDLFDIVNAKNPRDNQRVEKQLLGAPNFCNEYFPGVFTKVNSNAGVRIVQHGAQAQFINATEEDIWLYGPHGENFGFTSSQELRAYYRDQFNGRQAWTSKGLADLA